MKKRVVAALLVAVMSVGLLTACGDSKASNGENDQGEETVTVKWLFPGDKAEDHDMVMEDVNKKIKEKINVELDLEMIPQAEYNDKITLAASSQEDFDLMFTSSWLNPFNSNVAREGLLALDDLVAEYGQEMVASMPEWLLDVGKSGGTLYAIPNQQIIAGQNGVYIQEEYADKYGFDLTSMNDISDLYPFLDEVVANEPEKFPIDPRGVFALGDYEGIVNNMVYIKKGDTELELVPYTDIIGASDKLKKTWYDKGYVRQDIATVTDNTEDVKANRYVSSIGTYKPGGDVEFSANNNDGTKYIQVPFGSAYVGATNGSETMTAINVNSKNPEAAMKLLNLVYTDKEIFNELLFGIEGTHYTKTGENSAEPVADSKYNYSGQAWKFGNQFLAYTLPGQPEDVWEQTAKMNEEAEISPIRGFTFDPSKVQAEIAQINAVITEYMNMEYVAEDIEAFTAEKCQKIEQAGLQKVMDEVQRQLDDWKAEQ